MRLTLYTDYSLRVLIYLSQPDRREKWISTEEISSYYKISNHHLVKAVNHLGKLDYITIKRGRSGGIQLSKEPKHINLAEVVQSTEPDFYLAECFDSKTNTCPITSLCGLKGILGAANQSFLKTLRQFTLEDLLLKPNKVKPNLLSSKAPQTGS